MACGLLPGGVVFDDFEDGLVGRSGTLTRLRAARARGERLVVLTGPPGVGKSSLAKAFAREVAASGEAYVAYATGSSATDVLFAIARSLGIHFVDEPVDTWGEVSACLDAATTLLVVDGADVPRDAVREVVREVSETSQATIVVTSRWSLDLPGELVLAVPPLDDAAALRLLTREIVRRNPSHTIPPIAIARAAARLRGLPLAIEIVAMRAAKVGEAALDDDALDAPLPPATMARLLDPSFRELGEAATLDLFALSVFRPTFDLSAAQAVLGEDAASRVEVLVSASLVVPRGSRFEVIAVVRAEAARRARTSEPERLVRYELAHARFFSSCLAARADAKAAFSLLHDDRENFLAAFETLLAHGFAIEAARVAVRLDAGLVTSGPAWLHRSLLERAWSATEGLDAAGERADLGIALARFFAIRGRHERALAVLAAARAEGLDAARFAWISALRAFSLRPRGRHDEAREEGLAAVRAAVSLDDLVLECAATQIVGLVELDLGELMAASRAFDRALALARACGAPRLEGIVMANAALTALRGSRLDEAARLAACARTSLSGAGDAFHLVRVDILDGLVRLGRCELAEAERVLVRAAVDAKENGDRDGEVDARASLAEVALAKRDAAEARLALEEARIALRTMDDVAAHERVRLLSLRLAGTVSARLVLEDQGRRLRIDDRVVDLGRRVALRRLVQALVRQNEADPEGALDVPAMLAAGWPGERMRPESGAARVYMAVRRLRALGLGVAIETHGSGYRFFPSLEVVVATSAEAHLPSVDIPRVAGGSDPHERC